MTSTFRVIKAYKSAYPDPIIFKKGDILSTSPRESDWPGWLWCETTNGESRWVPDAYVNQSDGQTVMRHDYNPLELSVQVDELLTAYEQVNGWAWCINTNKQQGWVPLDCLLVA